MRWAVRCQARPRTIRRSSAFRPRNDAQRRIVRGRAWHRTLLLTAALAGCAREPEPALPRPNVLLVTIDTWRADRLSLYGGPVASPAHERIAASGLVFDRAFAQATQTRSSVPSLMTSLMPSATGTWDFSDSLSPRYVTLAEALRACGFATASFLQNGNTCDGTYRISFRRSAGRARIARAPFSTIGR